jgi:hypothetical protein
MFQTGYADSDKKLNRETMGTKQNILHTILDGHGDRMEDHGQKNLINWARARKLSGRQKHNG